MKLLKETINATSGVSSGANRHGRWYDDACGTAFALEILGERWALLVVRELMLGSRRFSDLRAALPGISAKVLTERLAALEASGVVARQPLPEPAKGQSYGLTAWGEAAEPLIQELGRWAAQSTAHNPRLPLSAVSLMLSLRTMLNRDACSRTTARIGFAIGDNEFIAEPAGNELPIRRASVDGAEAVFCAGSADIIAAGIYAGVPWEELEADGALSIVGDRALALRFAELFHLPPPLA
ncbi:winged helix-turn-helix transcriptional regulator [Porphyrobacter sp. ULC335]|uniref:winged helix-turn-helix transcriptional regulator n=1 Tax=Porphyrobacter sp. ULC335 TaxID=2854260 RepID=UPI00221E4970|nr:helix-turn-helix domain-containing protein [Porphyrobacter sp. ULC335]UYV16675.1 helix-turn-helix transcriptional regulator [Porphyrobacter sp. ULC335]